MLRGVDRVTLAVLLAGATLLIVVLAVGLVGDGIQDAFDPDATRER